MARNVIHDNRFQFALEIVALFKKLQAEREYVLSKQLLRSGTSIGANVEEALAGQGRLQKSNLMKTEVGPTIKNNEELIRILTSIVKTTGESPKIQN